MEKGDLATWVGSIGGTIGAIGTIAALIWAVKSALDDSRQSRKLASDAEAANRTAEQEATKRQAQRVYGWHVPPAAPPSDSSALASLMTVGADKFSLHLGNSSEEPVYEVVAYLVWVQGAAHRTGEEAEQYDGQSIYDNRAVLQTLPPGRFVVKLNGPSDQPMQGQLGVELAFTDHAGRHWIRRATGALHKINDAPLSHYGVHRPLQYSVARQPML